jgi:hypothetical protein
MGRTRKTALYVATALAALAAVNFVCPVVWFLTPVSGRVIDHLTGSPIADAAVAISWSLESWEGSAVDHLYCGEAITDENGEFRLTVWGPRFHFAPGRISRTQPEIRVIADGYLPVEARSSNDVTSAFIYAGPKHNGQTFRLDRTELGEAYERAVESFNNSITFVRRSWKCEWPQTRKRVFNARHGPSINP